VHDFKDLLPFSRHTAPTNIPHVISQHFHMEGPDMNQAQGVKLMTIKVPIDVHQKLLEWAGHNISSMNAELIRSARERAEREQEKAAAR
jgi:hypothetical protein